MSLSRMVLKLKWFSLLLLMFSFNVAAQAAGPEGMLRSIADQMIDNLQAHKVTLQSNRSYVFSLAYRLVVPHVDAGEMSRRVLPPQTWQNATASQRADFQKQFINLLVRTYATALASYTDQKIEFYPVRGGTAGRSTVEVNSQIISSNGAPAIAVRYSLINQGGSWKLYDMSVEGVSVIESFRSQFADALSQGDITALTQRLAQHNAHPASN